MAVQKSKKSRSKRNSRRNTNNVFKLPTLTFDKSNHEVHLRHFITKSGYYKGKKIINKKKEDSTK